jgi:hypothetical protein
MRTKALGVGGATLIATAMAVPTADACTTGTFWGAGSDGTIGANSGFRGLSFNWWGKGRWYGNRTYTAQLFHSRAATNPEQTIGPVSAGNAVQKKSQSDYVYYGPGIHNDTYGAMTGWSMEVWYGPSC